MARKITVVVTGRAMESREAIAVISLRTVIAFDIHPTDEELSHSCHVNAAPSHRMSMSEATGIDARLAEEFVALE